MKTEISRLKIKQILKSYIKENKTSNVILEQINDITLPDKLKKMVGCFNSVLNPTVTNMGGDGDPNHKFSIKTTGTKGGVRYFYIDGKVAEKLTPNAGIIFKESPEFDWEPNKCAPSQQSASYTNLQKSFIENWKQKGAKFQDELRKEEQNLYTKKLVSPKSKGIFTEDLYMWLPPANFTETTDSTISEFKKQAGAQTPKNNKDCKEAVKTFYDAYKNQLAIDLSLVSSLKTRVKACRTRYYQNWGFLQGGRNLNKMLEELAKVTSTEPWYVSAN